MKKARLLIDNYSDNASLELTAGTAEITMPLSNLQKYNNSRIFRTNDTDIEIKATMESAQWINGLVLWKHNLTSDATVRIVVKNAADETALDTGVIPAMGLKSLGDIAWGISELGETHFTDWKLAYSVFWFDLVNAKEVTITISDTTRTVPMDITRMYLGRAIEPEYNFDWGNGIEWNSNSKSYSTAGGSSHSIESEPWRECNISLEHITEGDRPHFAEAFRKVNTQKDWFISLYPEAGGSLERDYSFATKMITNPIMKRQNIKFYQANLQLREV